jgi:hypothetical protein
MILPETSAYYYLLAPCFMSPMCQDFTTVAPKLRSFREPVTKSPIAPGLHVHFASVESSRYRVTFLIPRHRLRAVQIKRSQSKDAENVTHMY